MTRIILIGYGAMGKEIESLAPGMDCEVVGVHDVDDPITKGASVEYDVAIDFTQPDVVLNNAVAVANAGKNLVIGTTGWYDHIDRIKEIQQGASNGIIYGSNFSIGVQMFFRLAKAAGALINNADEYDVMVHEYHHKRKKDSPSGTAHTTGKILLDAIERKKRMSAEAQHDRIDADTLHISSTRGGEVIGKHTITLDSITDTIEIQHNAKNRGGFASGALRAAKWIHERKGLYDFAEVFDTIIEDERS